MSEYLENLNEELSKVRTYLIKIRPKRRCGKIIETKFKEANELLEQYNTYIDAITKVYHLKSKQEKIVIDKYCQDFKLLYSEVKNLCNIKKESEEIILKMATFDLKVALSLLPVMTDNEENTKELIDSIEYYATTLDTESNKKLISFILKTRLSHIG